jgi:phage terminase large subunit GpA-like protein
LLFLDEIDAYPLDADGEGDPVDLAIRRTTTFRGRRKIFAPSTPTNKGQSRVEKGYQESDQRRYFVPCQGCGEFSTILFERLKFDKDERFTPPRAIHARFVCPECEYEHSEAEKITHLLPKGEWRATALGDGRIVGFHLSALYSPFETWEEVCSQFLAVKDDRDRFRVWWNTALAETWEIQGDAPAWEVLYERRESYRIGYVPMGPLVLTCGVDVQGNRIEAEVVGWGVDGRTSWSIDYRILEGDTSSVDNPVWSDVDALLDEVWPHESGVEMRIEMMAVDDGYNSQEVREWARHHSPKEVMVVRGQDNAPTALGQPKTVDITRGGKKLKRGMRYWPVGVSQLKSQLYGWLKLKKPLKKGQPFPQGYCHFPEYGQEYFEQLTAEVIVRRIVKGYTKFEWHKTRERNEALDTRNYARAGALRLGIERWRAAQWEERAVLYQTPIELATPPSLEAASDRRHISNEQAPPRREQSQPTGSSERGRRRRAMRSSYMG